MQIMICLVWCNPLVLVFVGGRHPISSALSDRFYHHRSGCASVHHSGSVWPSLCRPFQMQQETHHWLPQSMGLPSWPVPDPRFWEHHQSFPHWAPLPGELTPTHGYSRYGYIYVHLNLMRPATSLGLWNMKMLPGQMWLSSKSHVLCH